MITRKTSKKINVYLKCHKKYYETPSFTKIDRTTFNDRCNDRCMEQTFRTLSYMVVCDIMTMNIMEEFVTFEQMTETRMWQDGTLYWFQPQDG